MLARYKSVYLVLELHFPLNANKQAHWPEVIRVSNGVMQYS